MFLTRVTYTGDAHFLAGTINIPTRLTISNRVIVIQLLAGVISIEVRTAALCTIMKGPLVTPWTFVSSYNSVVGCGIETLYFVKRLYSQLL